jgi:hypothetical protein
MKLNTGIWIALLLLSTLSFSASETIRAGTLTIFILAAAGVKAALVGWQFMELRSAHLMWRVATFTLLAGVLGLVGTLVYHG